MKLIIPLLFLVLLTYERNSVWRDDYRLWKDAASKSPRKGRVLLNLGITYSSDGMNDLAVSILRRAISLYPSDTDLHHNLGTALAQMGKFEEAAKEFIRALDILQKEKEPFNDGLPFRKAWKIHNNLGNVFREMAMVDEAVDQHLLALRLNPGSALVHFI